MRSILYRLYYTIYKHFLKLSKENEPGTHVQSEVENPEITELNSEDGQTSDAEQEEELILQDEINNVLEAAKSLPDLPPDELENDDDETIADSTISNVQISELNIDSVPGLESVPKENPVIENREPDLSASPKSTGTNFTGVQLEKKQMAMFWDGEVVECEKIPDIVFTKENYYNLLLI